MQPNPTERDATGLTDQQENAAVLLATGLTLQAVADQIGVHRTTVWSWRKLETFAAYHSRLRADARDEAASALAALSAKAIKTLERLMESGSDATALRAAEMVLEAVRDQFVDETDPRRLIKRRLANEDTAAALDSLASFTGKPDGRYERECAALGIAP